MTPTGFAPEKRAVARWTRAQHRALDAWVESIQAILEALGEEEARAERVEEAVRHLEGLLRELLQHFANEEAADGFFAEALACAPRFESRVLTLRGQHATLRSQLEEVSEDAGYAGLSSEAWRAVAVSFVDFAMALRAHENAESGIVADAFMEDQGGGG